MKKGPIKITIIDTQKEGKYNLEQGGWVLSQINKGSIFSKILMYIFLVLGILSILSAFVFPIALRKYYMEKVAEYKNIGDLGSIGDFLGGTTVGLLTAASIFMLLATIIMQRKEIKISQESLTELVKQTEASVNQAKDARAEVEITNETMKRQQFESAFFNMINLHHTILSNMKFKELIGRDLIKNLFDILEKEGKEGYLKYKIENEISDETKKHIFIDLFDLETRDIFLNMLYEKGNYLTKEAYAIEEMKINNKETPDFDPSFIEIEGDRFFTYKDLIENTTLTNEIIRLSKLKNINSDHAILKDHYLINDEKWLEEKQIIYTKFYIEYEYLFGHYYRNLYRIVKFINESKLINNDLKKEYRGILRAQLSSYELMMLFYNVSYSEKGKKFKEQLTNCNFFDNHLLTNKFIWNDDCEVLELIE